MIEIPPSVSAIKKTDLATTETFQHLTRRDRIHMVQPTPVRQGHLPLLPYVQRVNASPIQRINMVV